MGGDAASSGPRTRCPTEDALAAFVQGHLSRDVVVDIERHLDVCARCLDTMAELGKLLVPRQPQSGVGEELGPYRILAPIGWGGMGAVFVAEDPRLGRRVALKVVRPDVLARSDRVLAHERMLQEARAAAKISHAHVLPVHEVGVGPDGQVYIAFEYVDGHTLREWLDLKPRTVGEIVEVFLAVGEGLAAVHEAGLVHRDVKPSNVLVARNGGVFLSDFGLATSPDSRVRAEVAGTPLELDGGSEPWLTRSRGMWGTPAYMAPEQLAGRSATARSDQYAFCVSLHEALHGHRPPARATELRPVARRLRQLVHRGLRSDPEDRFGSMAAMLVELRKVVEPPRRGGLWLAVAGVVVAAALWAVGPTTDACDTGAELIEAAWGRDARQAGREAFEATDTVYAGEAWKDVERRLDAYAERWRDEYRGACADRPARPGQAAVVLACLESAASHVHGVADALANADATTVAGAWKSLEGLPSPGDCDADAWRHRPPPPEAIRGELAEVERRLARARALRLAESHAAAREILDALTPDVDAIDWPPLTAELRYEQAIALEYAGDHEGAWATYHEAMWAATEGLHPRELARILISLTDYATMSRNEAEAGERFARHADAVLRSLGGDPSLEAALEANRANAHVVAGRLQEGREGYARALAQWEEADASPVLLGLARSNLAKVANLLREPEEALVLWRALCEELEQSPGPRHPATGRCRGGLGFTLSDLGRHAEAIVELERAETIVTEALGPEHREVVNAAWSLGVAQLDAGRADEAVQTLTRALRASGHGWGEDHPATVSMRGHLGEARWQAGDRVGGLATMEQAVNELAAIDAPTSTRANAELALAKALWEHGGHARALALARSARDRMVAAADEGGVLGDVEAWLADKETPGVGE